MKPPSKFFVIVAKPKGKWPLWRDQIEFDPITRCLLLQRWPASVLRHFLIAKPDGKPVPTLPALLLEFGVDVDDVNELVVDELLDA